jgi:hypothetical protein
MYDFASPSASIGSQAFGSVGLIPVLRSIRMGASGFACDAFRPRICRAFAPFRKFDEHNIWPCNHLRGSEKTNGLRILMVGATTKHQTEKVISRP